MNNAADKAVQKAFNEMVDKNNIRPFIQPELVVEEFKADKLAFKFVVINTPTVEVGEYKGLTVEKLDTTVTEEDIDSELKALANLAPKATLPALK
jgi:trigger factor